MVNPLQIVSCGHFVAIPEHYCHRPESPNNLLIWIVGGRGRLKTESFDGPVGAGTLLAMRRGPAHTYASDPIDPWTILWVHFEGAGDEQWLHRLRVCGGPVVPLAADGRLRERWLEMLGTFRGPQQRDRALADHLLVALLGLIEHRLASRPAAGSQPERVAAVQAYVQDHLADRISTADLGRVANLSPAQLTRVMQAHLGCPPMGYVLGQRIAQAAALLRETARPIKAVAADVGYDDPYYFSRLFRRRMGVSPAHYRAGQRKTMLEADSAADGGNGKRLHRVRRGGPALRGRSSPASRPAPRRRD